MRHKISRKYLSFLGLFFILSILGSCANYATEENVSFWEVHTTDDFSSSELSEVLREYLLYDFDYLTHQILRYSPHLNVIERRLGVNLEERFATARELIENFPLYMATGRERTSEELTRIIAENFMNAHLEPLFRPVQIAHMAAYQSRQIERYYFFHQSQFDIFKEENVRIFYRLDRENVPSFQPMMEINPNNIITDVIFENYIAYLRIGSFVIDDTTFENNRERLLDFFEKIQSYEHLIIDLRGNMGGLPVFQRLVHELLIAEEQIPRIYQFFVRDYFGSRHNMSQMLEIDERNGIVIHTIEEFLETRNMYNVNLDDLAKMGYVVELNPRIIPDEDAVPFGGNIWILVDESSASATELVVLTSQSTGFATVVGSHTMGVMPSFTTLLSLPHTGIVVRFDTGYFTDETGRSLEEFGIEPDYFNREGLNALETVLEMIEEMNEFGR